MSDASYIVFFDGGCPLCSREIAHYRGLQAFGAINWLDVSVAGVDLASYGITQDQAMRRFHVMDAEGTCILAPTVLWRFGHNFLAIGGSRGWPGVWVWSA